jgi:energy-coupling factor transporter ATP-binding protein EcfA2
MLHPFAAERYVGSVYRVEAGCVEVTLPSAAKRARAHYGERLARGEVGEFLVVDIGNLGLVGRISDVWVNAAERDLAASGTERDVQLHPVGRVQLLASIGLDGEYVRGIERYPRVGDAAYAASADVLTALIAEERVSPELPPMFDMGELSANEQVNVRLDATRLFGRHLAVLGSTGSGKSWTLAHLTEEVARVGGKLLLFDATGEFHTLGDLAQHVAIGPENDAPQACTLAALPHFQMSESNFYALVRPSAAAQMPRLREAIRSLRLAYVLGDADELVDGEGCIKKEGLLRAPFLKARKKHIKVVEGSGSPFNIGALPRQIQYECVYDNDTRDQSKFGGRANNDLSYCTTLIARLYDILETPALMGVLDPVDTTPPVFDVIDDWLKSDTPVLRLSLRYLPFSHYLREIVVDAIGRHLLDLARARTFASHPLLVAVDEAHQFFGRTVGDDVMSVHLEQFESIAKEGRKYGLTLCMATQRPADLPAGVMSQAGMLLVHRLGDGRDRDYIEKASSELDRSAARLLPALVPGEALFVGVDFPVPVAVKVPRPLHAPESEGPKYAKGWVAPAGIST